MIWQNIWQFGKSLPHIIWQRIWQKFGNVAKI